MCVSQADALPWIWRHTVTVNKSEEKVKLIQIIKKKKKISRSCVFVHRLLNWMILTWLANANWLLPTSISMSGIHMVNQWSGVWVCVPRECPGMSPKQVRSPADRPGLILPWSSPDLDEDQDGSSLISEVTLSDQQPTNPQSGPLVSGCVSWPNRNLLFFFFQTI